MHDIEGVVLFFSAVKAFLHHVSFQGGIRLSPGSPCSWTFPVPSPTWTRASNVQQFGYCNVVETVRKRDAAMGVDEHT